jgi:hypothetical protein
VGPLSAAGGGTLADNRFAKTVTIEWATLRDDYFEALRRAALPLHRIFGTAGWWDPDAWLTREAVEAQFAQQRMRTIRLFDED